MALDNAKNFAKSTLASGISNSATSLTVATGEGSKFPTASFNATIWNKTDYFNPADDPNVEIVRVTAVATDTFTVTRGQESTSAVAHNTAGKVYGIIAGLTAKVINTDIPNNPSFTGTVSVASAITQAGAADHIVITPGASKLVKVAVLRQDNTTNTYTNSSVILTGWGYGTGNATASWVQETVTFGITFTQVPIVVGSSAGYRDATDPTLLSDLAHWDELVYNGGGITTTTFVASIAKRGGTNVENGRRVGYTWIAIGTF